MKIGSKETIEILEERSEDININNVIELTNMRKLIGTNELIVEIESIELSKSTRRGPTKEKLMRKVCGHLQHE